MITLYAVRKKNTSQYATKRYGGMADVLQYKDSIVLWHKQGFAKSWISKWTKDGRYHRKLYNREDLEIVTFILIESEAANY